MRDNPHIRQIPGPRIPAYYVQEMAYTDPYKLGEHHRTLLRKVYWTLRGMAVSGNPPRVMRIKHLHLSADWESTWTNLHECWTTETVKIEWYESLHEILLVDSLLCGHCGEPGTVQHRVTSCSEGARYSMDSVHCLGPYATGLDETPVPAMATSATPSGVMDTDPNGVVQN